MLLLPRTARPPPRRLQSSLRLAVSPPKYQSPRYRRYSQPHTPLYGAVVAGAGPGGLAVLGNLLDAGISGKILWVDPKFEAGWLGEKWRQVPSNTKVSLFTAYAQGTLAFQSAAAALSTPNGVTALESLNADETCPLNYAADMVQSLTQGFSAHPQVEKQLGTVTGADYSSATRAWTVTTHSPALNISTTVPTALLALSTGSHPTATNIPIPGLSLRPLSVQTALHPDYLASAFPATAPNPTVAVIGSSHTAVLILYNLVALARRPDSPVPGLKVKWFSRSALRYAEPRDGWILRDNTGLKGMAATWAKANLEGGDAGPVADVVQRVDTGAGKEVAAYARELPACTEIVQAIGFSPNAGPRITVDGRQVPTEFDNVGGGFFQVEGKGGVRGARVPGLYGAGIAYPERVTDPEGNVEHAVGMFKFMKFLRRVAPEWVKSVQG